ARPVPATLRLPLLSTLFPYTTLFRSDLSDQRVCRRLGSPSRRPLARPKVATSHGSLHTRLPIASARLHHAAAARGFGRSAATNRSEEHTSELQSRFDVVCRLVRDRQQ